MLHSVLALGLSLVCFLIMLILLTKRVTFARRIIGILSACSAAAGLVLYGWCYSEIFPDLVNAVLRAVYAVFGMFLGKNEYGAIERVPLMQLRPVQWIFWLFHMLAFYCTASVVLVAFGEDALRAMRRLLSRRGALCVIYGVNEDSVALGRQLSERKDSALVFLGPAADTLNRAILEMHSFLLSSDPDIRPDRKFLKKLGIRDGRRLTIYALDKNVQNNVSFAIRLRDALQEAGISPDHTRLVLCGGEQNLMGALQADGERYGYGNALIYDEAAVTARGLLQQFPPCEALRFDRDGMALDSFETLVVGYGHTGHEVLRQLIMNGQFHGSRFRADVFAPDFDRISGELYDGIQELRETYRIRFHPQDARSGAFYGFLKEHIRTLRYIVICTGNLAVNEEISRNIKGFLRSVGSELPVHQCYRRSFTTETPSEPLARHWGLYRAPLLISEETDRMAMAYNQYYCRSNGKTMQENWRNCDSFSRDSCRAAADFLPAMLYALGKTREDVLDGDWELTDQQKETLGRTEHLRWCAFHAVHGYRVMREEEFQQRAAEYEKQKRETGSSRIRISKNTDARTHACMIPWEELDALSAREQAITGKAVDYKAADVNNLLVIPEALRLLRDMDA